MIIGILKVELFLPNSHSLKSKRMILKSIKDRVRNRFNVAVCEIEHHDTWQRAVLGFCTIGNARKYLEGQLNHVINQVEKNREAELIDYGIEMI